MLRTSNYGTSPVRATGLPDNKKSFVIKSKVAGANGLYSNSSNKNSLWNQPLKPKPFPGSTPLANPAQHVSRSVNPAPAAKREIIPEPITVKKKPIVIAPSKIPPIISNPDSTANDIINAANQASEKNNVIAGFAFPAQKQPGHGDSEKEKEAQSMIELQKKRQELEEKKRDLDIQLRKEQDKNIKMSDVREN